MPVDGESYNSKVILHFYINMEQKYRKEECIIGLQEYLTVEMLFCDIITRDPTKLFWPVREFQVIKGLNYRQHLDTNKLMFGIAHWNCGSIEYREYALHLLGFLRAKNCIQNQECNLNSHLA